MIGKIEPESDSDVETGMGKEGIYRGLEVSPDNHGYEAGDEGDSPKYQDVEAGLNNNNNNNANDYQEVGAPTIGEAALGSLLKLKQEQEQ